MKKKTLLAITLGGLSTLQSISMEASINKPSPQATDTMRELAYSYLSARVVHVACYYKLFDELESGPKTAAEIANGYYRPEAVRRMFRTLANHGAVNMDEDERFSLNEKSQLLISSAVNTLQPAFAKEFDLKRWEAIGNLHLTLHNDVVPFDALNKMSCYEYFQRNEEAGRLFNAGMKNFSEREDAQVSEAFDFEAFTSYCDIGGGTGGLLSCVLGKHQKVQGILFDLPEAVSECKLPGVRLEGGNFFESVPHADVYTIKRVLHNWKDEPCVKILMNTTSAMSDNGRILVVEKVLPRKPDGSLLADADIIGLALGGQERTLGEFIKLGKMAGLELEEQTVLASGVSVLAFKKS
jgi:O-methyltransferase domain